MHLKKTAFIATVTGLVGGAAFAASPTKPNILFVFADQLRASATGYAGDPNVRTPNLDTLAKQGLNFRNAVSVCPVCTPYRAALITGRFPTSTGMFLNDAYLPDREVSIAEVLKPAGYDTAYIGKWHLDGHGRASYIPPERRQGFDYWKVAECDHSYNHSHYYTGTSSKKQFWDGYDAFAQTKDAQQYLRDHARTGKPFCLFLSYGIPHFPHGTAPARFKALYPPDKIQLPPNVPPALQTESVRTEAQGYYAHVAALDQCIGGLTRTLAEAGLADNTILVFTSDHGEMMGSQGIRPYTKQVVYDEAAHVPFLLRYPRVQGPKGHAVFTPLTTPDIMPTLLGLVGVAIPATVEGKDLSALVTAGEKELPGHDALYMGVAPFARGGNDTPYRAIRTSRYTFARRLEGPWVLFDDRNDPFQTNNLIGQPALVREMEQRLQKALNAAKDDFRAPAYYVEKFGYELAPHGSISYAPGAKVQSPKQAVTAPRTESATPPKPNIVVVLADDFGFGDAACYDPKFSKIPTPNIDRLAREGMRFTEAHSSSAVCTPTRYGLLTGRYNWRSRLQGGVLAPYAVPLIARDRLTVAGLLKQQGYHTACIGKWHLGWQWPKRDGKEVFDQPIAEGPTTRGFDYYFGTDVPNYPPYTFIENDRVTVQPTAQFYAATAREMVLHRDGPMAPGWQFDRILPTLAEKAVDYIGQRARTKQPFFLYFPLTTPHEPIAPSAQFKGRSGISAVGDLIMESDWALGRVMEALGRHGAAENTLLIFTSDNGHCAYTGLAPFEKAGHRVSGPFRGYKMDAWDGGHHQPFVARWPGVVKAGSQCAQLASLNDLMATCAEITSAQVPATAGEDSFSLLPLLRGENRPIREAVVSHSARGMFAIQRGEWKLILGQGSGGGRPGDTGPQPGQLYNLTADVGETNNLYAQHPEVVTELNALLKRYVQDGRSTVGPKQKNDVPVNWNRTSPATKRKGKQKKAPDA